MRVYYKILSVVMAFMVLLSTFSFTVDMHYCGNTLVDTSFFGKAHTCGMEKQNFSNCKGRTVNQKDCCSEKQFFIKGQAELMPIFFHSDLVQYLFFTPFVASYINIFEGIAKRIIPFKNYIPPLLVRDIHKLDQTYLI